MSVLARSVTDPIPRWPMPRSTWQRLAACRGYEVNVFFPDQHGDRYAHARAICSSCLVVEACRRMADRAEDGLPAGAIFGMFAGETPRERVARRRG